MKTRTSIAGSERRGRAPGAAGFTLIEVLLVMVLATALLTVVPPMLGNVMDSVRFKDTSRRLIAGLSQARTVAIAQNRETVVTLDLEARQISLGGRDKRYPIDESIEVELTTAESELHGEQGGSIRFFPDGSSTGGRIRLLSDSRGLDLDVDWLTGRVAVSEP